MVIGDERISSIITSTLITCHASLVTVLHGAHDADRTRDLVLTKDVLYQLSYVGVLR